MTEDCPRDKIERYNEFNENEIYIGEWTND